VEPCINKGIVINSPIRRARKLGAGYCSIDVCISTMIQNITIPTKIFFFSGDIKKSAKTQLLVKK
jgi:hypothetical protein